MDKSKRPASWTAGVLAGLITAQDLIGDLPVTNAIVAALLRREFGNNIVQGYVIIDENVDREAIGIDEFFTSYTDSVLLWHWDDDMMERGDEGYGDVNYVKYPSGPGLQVNVAGSPGNSALPVYIVPVPSDWED